MSFTKRQIDLIAFCKSAGHGWKRFAESVEHRGKCSPKQEDTLCIMKQRIELAKVKFKNQRKHNINECEIMSFGLYI